jgi:ligand-binding SRPBCC domain-containing protein
MMRVHTLRREQTIDRTPDEVFAFFSSPENLAAITPPWLAFRILTPRPLVAKAGGLIDYTIRWMGIPVRWTTIITDWDPPRKFVDQQVRGPYSLWHHEHAIEATAEGTRMTDTVTHVLPFGIVGELAYRLLVRRQLEEIFDYRAAVIKRVFPPKAGEDAIRPAPALQQMETLP